MNSNPFVKQCIWAATFSFLLINPSITHSFESQITQLGPEPVKKGRRFANAEKLSPFDDRSAYVCPNDRVFLLKHDTAIGMSRDYLDFRYLSYQFSEKDGKWIGTPDRFANRKDPKSIRVNIEMLVSTKKTGFTKDQLRQILNRFKRRSSMPETSYKLHQYVNGGRGAYESFFVLKNSEEKELKIWIYGNDVVIGSGDKKIASSPGLGLYEHNIFSCTDQGELHNRYIAILNDKGNNPGKIVKYPALIIIFDTYRSDTIQVRESPDISF